MILKLQRVIIALSLNTALLQDGVIVEIADGADIRKPIEIRHVMLGGGLATVAQPRCNR